MEQILPILSLALGCFFGLIVCHFLARSLTEAGFWWVAILPHGVAAFMAYATIRIFLPLGDFWSLAALIMPAAYGIYAFNALKAARISKASVHQSEGES